ncbi:MAG: response regulator [Candidatus Levybacteria bacterium]|nr:response regulator [Candidatus Levybacteria bacterium]
MKILLIEDDRFFQKFYASKLKEQNIDVDIASDGEEGLLKMRNGMPDLILLDLIMPKIDGFSVLKSRLQDPTLAKIPVIVFSTLGQENDVKFAKSLGANDYINKSFFDFGIMMTKVNNIMKMSRVENIMKSS